MGFSGSNRSELEVPAQQVALAPGLSAIFISHPGCDRSVVITHC